MRLASEKVPILHFFLTKLKTMKTDNNIHENGHERMSSLEIAELSGKPHNDVMKAIRKMEIAWQKGQGGNFSLSSRTYELPNRLRWPRCSRTNSSSSSS